MINVITMHVFIMIATPYYMQEVRFSYVAGFATLVCVNCLFPLRLGWSKLVSPLLLNTNRTANGTEGSATLNFRRCDARIILVDSKTPELILVILI